jgi:hypothetical protein
MNDEDIARLADVVSKRVFDEMSRFIDVLENVMRDNERLLAKVEDLEWALYGEHDDDLSQVPDDELDEFFDGCWEPDEDEGEPTFD